MILLLDNLFNPTLIAKFMNKRNMDGKTGFDLVAEMKLFKVLQTRVVYRILMMNWRSKIDSSASFLEQATSNRVL